MWKDELHEHVQASVLSAEDKEAWASFANLLDEEMGDFLISYLKEEPGALERMNEEVRLKREYMATGDAETLKQVKGQNQAQIDALNRDNGEEA